MAMSIRSRVAKMLLCFVLGLLAVADIVLAQSATTSAPSSATSGGPAATHTVYAGSDGFSFIPNSIQANVGDTVLFVFYPQNHSVARAEFGYPCIPYENTGPGKVGFWSGFQPVAQFTENGPKYAVRVNSTEPVFFYCAADGACVPDGMIGVINPNATQTLAAQYAYQKNASVQLYPGEPLPAESTPTPSPSATAAPSAGSSSGLGAGAIAGIVVGVVVLIGVAGLICYLCGRTRSLASVVRYSQPPLSRPVPKNVPYLPHTPSPANTPYSPNFSSTGASTLHPHDSWNTQSGLRPTSPEMLAQQRTMSPNSLLSGYGQQGYNPIDNPGNMAPAYQPHPSPPFIGYGGVQYAQVPGHDVAPVHDASNSAASSPSFHQNPNPYTAQQSQAPQEPAPSHDEVHELDARSAIPDTPGAAPPQYAARAFSFSEGSDAPPGVEKVLRD